MSISSFIVFWRQFRAIAWKNWIILGRNPVANFFRCFGLPVAFGLFIAFLPDLISHKSQELQSHLTTYLQESQITWLLPPNSSLAPNTPRTTFLYAIYTILFLPLYFTFVGISFHLPGGLATERAAELTSQMRAVGLLESSNIGAWHFSTSLVYLPSWLVISLAWKYRLFWSIPIAEFLGVHVLLGISLASWSFITSFPFRHSPQLAAVISVFSAVFAPIVVLIADALNPQKEEQIQFLWALFFPPAFYVKVIREYCLKELGELPGRPEDYQPVYIIPMFIAASISVLVWPRIAVLLEELFDTPVTPTVLPWQMRRNPEPTIPLPPAADYIISLKAVNKTFGNVNAVSDFNLDIPRHGLCALLGINGAGKSTILSIIAGLLAPTSGSVFFYDSSGAGSTALPRGTLGIVPQQNILFPDLTCLQSLRLWRAIKVGPRSINEDEDLEQLLRDCDLSTKIHAQAHTLSGGQKRKLHLAIGLVGGSKIVLVDECTTGVDPLSRRALWRALTMVRGERTVLFTTHFLDEVDYLADRIAIISQPGKVLAQGTPVSLKRDLGEGYSIIVSFTKPESIEIHADELLKQIRDDIAPDVYLTTPSPNQLSLHLQTKEAAKVEAVLSILDRQKKQLDISSYDISGTSFEDVFMKLVSEPPAYADVPNTPILPATSGQVDLADGQQVSPLTQAFTIFHKRCLVARRSWLYPLLAVGMPVFGSVYLPFWTGTVNHRDVTPLEWVTLSFPPMAIYPAFFALYVSQERRTSVQAMQFSNGLSNPWGLWLGHLFFDSIFVGIIVGIVVGNLWYVDSLEGPLEFVSLGLLTVILALCGITATIISYCVSLLTSSTLAAFALAVGVQFLGLWVYGVAISVAGILGAAQSTFVVIHVLVSLVSPAAILARSMFISLVIPLETRTPLILNYESIGHIAYLLVYSVALLYILVLSDSGRFSFVQKATLSWSLKRSPPLSITTVVPSQDVVDEALAVAESQDTLRVVNVSKSFGGEKALVDISLGVSRDTVFASLGPNGAGKTTLINTICGDLRPDNGEVFIEGTPVTTHIKKARMALGVCPQFTAIDAHLTVREHLWIYGRLKGVGRKALTDDIDLLVRVTGLAQFKNRLATTLSGGNQRKLALAIALIGNPPVLLIDEFSSGIDAKAKRDLWRVLKQVMPGKAVVISTHSMEEATALATKVGIMAKRMLAVGTVESLYERYSSYEVHFSCITRQETLEAQKLMSQIPGAQLMEDVATRFEVPLGDDANGSLLSLFRTLAAANQEGLVFAVGKGTLDGVYLKVIRENQVHEDAEA